MNPFLSLSYSARGAILMYLYALLLIQFCCVLFAGEQKEKYRLPGRMFLFILSAAFLFLMRDFNQRINTGSPVTVHMEKILFEQLPCAVLFLILIVAGIVTCFLVCNVIRYHRTSLTRSSIKESMDSLPSGLCFSSADGFVLLANRTMERLCQELTGSDLQDANAFWKQLVQKDLLPENRRIVFDGTLCFQLKNKEIWTFQRERLAAEDENVFQIFALNISELYHLFEELEQKNVQLAGMNRRLKKYSENLDTFVRSREILDAKIRIHKEIGQTLFTSRAYLIHNDLDLSEEEIFTQWEYIVRLLKKETSLPRNEHGWAAFVNEAQNAGVSILTSGRLPTESNQLELIQLAAAEALTNAVRHAQADALYIQFSEKSGCLQMRIINNGKKAPEAVQEGGGLGSLRIRLEEAGGQMHLETCPQFCLSVTLPEKGAENHASTSIDR